MPQMNKGGKFIFGKSLIRENLSLFLPTQALEEYHMMTEDKVYLFTGSKVTGAGKTTVDTADDGFLESANWNGITLNPKQ